MPAIPSRRALVATATVAVAGAAFGLPTGAATPTATAAPFQPRTTQDAHPVLHLRGGDVVVGRSRSVAPGLAPRPLAAGEKGAYVVQLSGPVTPAARSALESAGARVLGYLPDFAFKVRLAADRVEAVRGLPGVVGVERMSPQWRLAKDARAAIDAGRPTLYTVTIDPDITPAAGRAVVAKTGAVATGRGRVLTVAATPAQLRAIAQRDEVADLTVWELPTSQVLAQQPAGAPGVASRHTSAALVANDKGGGDDMSAKVANGRGYDGSSQTVAVADTGLGTGEAATAFKDLAPSRITAILDYPSPARPGCMTPENDGPRDVASGHGTHTAISVSGGGDASGVGKAPAPAVHLVFQAVENWTNTEGNCALVTKSGYLLTGIPEDIGELFQAAYDKGA